MLLGLVFLASAVPIPSASSGSAEVASSTAVSVTNTVAIERGRRSYTLKNTALVGDRKGALPLPSAQPEMLISELRSNGLSVAIYDEEREYSPVIAASALAEIKARWHALDSGGDTSVDVTVWIVSSQEPRYHETRYRAPHSAPLRLTFLIAKQREQPDVAILAGVVDTVTHELFHVAASTWAPAANGLDEEISAYAWGLCAQQNFGKIIGAIPRFRIEVRSDMKRRIAVSDGHVLIDGLTGISDPMLLTQMAQASLYSLLTERTGSLEFDMGDEKHLEVLGEICARVAHGIPDFARPMAGSHSGLGAIAR